MLGFGPRRSRSLRPLVWVVLLLLLTGASPAFAAKQPQLPPRFGFGTVPLYPELAEDLGLDKDLKGLVIVWVYQGSPAESAGLKPGEVLVKAGKGKSKPNAVPDEAHWQTATRKLRANEDWTFYVIRDGKEKPVPIRTSTSEFGAPLQPAPNPQPATLKAAADGSGDAKTLAGALLKARPGDTILVAGSHAAAPVVLDNLTLASLDPAAPGEVAGLDIVAASGVKVKGLRVGGNPKLQSSAGIYIHEAKGATVESCTIWGFATGISVASSEGVVIEDNRITQNIAGIVTNSSGVKISRNLVLKNATTATAFWGSFSGGIIVNSGKAEVTQNTVLENRVPEYSGADGTGIWIRENANAVVANNIVGDNSIGVMVAPSAQATVEYNDVFGHFIQSKKWSKGNNEYQLQGGNANFLSEINTEYKPQPIFPIINFEPDRWYYTLVLRFQPSQTNLSADPLFADRLNGDYRLAPDSPLANRGRGGTHIGAFAPIVVAPAVSPVRGETPAATGAAAAPAAPAAAATPPVPAPPSPPPAAPSATFKAWVHANTLYVQAEGADALVGRLKQRLAENPQNLDRVKQTPVGVVPFALTGGEGVTLSPSLAEDLTNAMINAGLRPANQGLLTKAMAELAVKDSGQVDQSLGRELAQRANCKFLLLGSVSDRGQTVVLSLRLFEAETG
ncbi:MAG: right-handed parallel beta-helix repeat-containing protein, partial [Chitinophagales bacterium]